MNWKYNFELFDLNKNIVDSKDNEKRKPRLPLLLGGTQG